MTDPARPYPQATAPTRRLRPPVNIIVAATHQEVRDEMATDPNANARNTIRCVDKGSISRLRGMVLRADDTIQVLSLPKRWSVIRQNLLACGVAPERLPMPDGSVCRGSES